MVHETCNANDQIAKPFDVDAQINHIEKYTAYLKVDAGLIENGTGV